MENAEVTIRLSTVEDEDATAVRQLATSGRAAPPRGPVMLAGLDGQAIAAVGLGDGAMVADPVRTNPSILTLLSLRRLEARLLMAVWGA